MDGSFKAILVHAVGLDKIKADLKYNKDGKKYYNNYRNSYIARSGDKDCEEMEEFGLIRKAHEISNMVTYKVTDKGFDMIEDITGYRCMNYD